MWKLLQAANKQEVFGTLRTSHRNACLKYIATHKKVLRRHGTTPHSPPGHAGGLLQDANNLSTTKACVFVLSRRCFKRDRRVEVGGNGGSWGLTLAVLRFKKKGEGRRCHVWGVFSGDMSHVPKRSRSRGGRGVVGRKMLRARPPQK